MQVINRQKVSFKSVFGNTLAASLELPINQPSAYVLLAHCFTCSKDNLTASRISRALTDSGFAVLRFDFTGLGGSEGDFANTNFSSNIQDLLQAATFLKQNYAAPKLLIGHSLGGTASLAAAAQLPELTAIVTIAAPSDPVNIEHLIGEDKINQITSEGEAEVNLGGRLFKIKKQFLDDIHKHNLLDTVHTMNKALLIFHSPEDAIVSITHARRIFDAAKHPKSFISLEGADHLLTNKDDAIYVANVIAAWASRYVFQKKSVLETPTAAVTTEAGTVVVTETKQGLFINQIVAGNHTLTADEPKIYGGNDAGPSPYDFLLASLGACTSMTVRYYANAKKFPLTKVSVSLTIKKIHAEDCKNCESDKSLISHIERIIDLQGELTEEQRNKLLEFANNCPVSRTLTSKIQITTTLTK
jgi:uncharacterized OsmC-like protein/alpha-beta hydrolase superfamily lysophospholipase